jgi:TrmH family RNA methyltransferase
MISKQQVKFVNSLKIKKYRSQASAFLVEGAKNVNELLQSDFEILHLFVTEKYLDSHGDLTGSRNGLVTCSQAELEQLGSFRTNEYALAVAAMKPPREALPAASLMLALDGISDPGNLGTIIRIADWYGIDQIIASHGTADFYNPKVINSSMGSFARVEVSYLDLGSFFNKNSTSTVYGACLDGEDVHKQRFKSPVVVLLGNESQGISAELLPYLDCRITIPRVGRAESLNVAVSAAIICDNYFRT